jgi:hypothetical protein
VVLLSHVKAACSTVRLAACITLSLQADIALLLLLLLLLSLPAVCCCCHCPLLLLPLQLTGVAQSRTATPSHTKIALYHYLTKSEHEYMQKMKRGSAAGNYKSPEFFHTINKFATATCTTAIPLGLKCCPSATTELGQQGVQQVQQRLAALQQKGRKQ